MSRDYVSHLAADNRRDTECGEPWQGWQAPAGPIIPVPDGTVVHLPPREQPLPIRVPPYDQPRPHLDPIRQCRACMRVAALRLSLELATRRSG